MISKIVIRDSDIASFTLGLRCQKLKGLVHERVLGLEHALHESGSEADRFHEPSSMTLSRDELD